jgi:hypothetical protein
MSKQLKKPHICEAAKALKDCRATEKKKHISVKYKASNYHFIISATFYTNKEAFTRT